MNKHSMKSQIFCILFVSLLVYAAQCSKILLVFPTLVRSHFKLGNALARGLAEAGHEVTMVSPFEERDPPKKGKYRNVVLTRGEMGKSSYRNNYFEMHDTHPISYFLFITTHGNEITKRTFQHPNFQKLLKSDEHFDVVIVQQYFNDAHKVLAYYYKAPLILFSTFGPNSMVNNLIGNPSPPSYIPDLLLSYTSNMDFRQRLVNWLFTVMAELHRHVTIFPSQNKIMKEYFPDAPDLSVLNYNVSLVFLNSHESVTQAVPHVPNMIDIGGFHTTASKELPKDLKEFMDNATEGVVYFNLGSYVQPSQMTEGISKAILGALGKIKRNVLWKWDEDSLPEKPENVIISKWFPQWDILAHPNVKLFITHGGLMSVTETIYQGVPILALPIFEDQKMNAAKAEMDGYGLTLYFSELSEDKLYQALNTLLNNPQYRENAKRRSKLIRDRPMNPLALAIYWTEFVIRHKGAPHLRVAGVDLPWYRYLLLDVILFVILLITSLIITLVFVVRKALYSCKKSTHKLKKN